MHHSNAGINALARARLAGEILQQRLAPSFPELRVECLGGEAYRYGFLEGLEPTREYRLRIVGRAQTQELAEEIGREVEALLTNGPAGGGGPASTSRKLSGSFRPFCRERRSARRSRS